MSIDALVVAVRAMTFDVPEDVIRQHVEAATQIAAEYHLPIDLILGIEYVSTKFVDAPVALDLKGDLQ
jgi:hypothetical protein